MNSGDDRRPNRELQRRRRHPEEAGAKCSLRTGIPDGSESCRWAQDGGTSVKSMVTVTDIISPDLRWRDQHQFLVAKQLPSCADRQPMADISREHNNSPQVGVVRNNDPALDIKREHHHEHLHHSARAEAGHTEHDHVAYTTGTTPNEPSIIPAADPNDDALHRRHKAEKYAAEHDIEKTGGLEYEEKGSLGKGRVSSDPDSDIEDPKRHTISSLYRKYRIWVHLFVAALFTG